MSKVIVAGSRDIDDVNYIYSVLHNTTIKEVVSGLARGPDSIGLMWADETQTPVKVFAADWGKHGKKAGYLRNVEMGQYADRLVAFWDGESKGTRHMINIMLDLGKPVEVHIVKAT